MSASTCNAYVNFNSMKVRLIPAEPPKRSRLKKFQFHEGSINTTFATFWASAEGYFNSMKVRLIQLPTVSPSPPVSFQFHEGSINTLRLAHQATLLRYFNSMKVRLIHTLAPIWAAAHQFQFHEGSINTEDSEQRKRPPRPFQFHEGSINTISSFSFLATRFNFNSMKVRLIHSWAVSAGEGMYRISIPWRFD